MLLLAANLENEIREHGAKDYPHECCGAMLGTDGDAGREVRSLFPLINRRDDSPRNRFSIAPEDFRAAEHAARRVDSTCWDGIILIRSPGAPERVRSGACLAVVQLCDRKRGSGKSKDLTSWRLEDDRSKFQPEEVLPVRAASQGKQG